MSVEAQRTQLTSLLGAVTGIGTVQGQALALLEEADLVAAFGRPVLGCQVDREGTEEAPLVSRQHEATHGWLIQVVMDIDEAAASPVTFQTLLEAIRTALRADPTLGGTAEGTSGPPQCRVAGHRDFGGYLVHYGEITFAAIEAVDY